MATANKPLIGWLGAGRMGFDMAKRLAQAGCDISVWNRTRSKAEPLAQYGAKIVDKASELGGCDLIFSMLATYDDVSHVILGKDGLLAGTSAKAKPRLLARADGMHYWTPDGRAVLDGVAGLWCVNAGHGRREITDAVARSMQQLDYAPPFQMGHPQAFELANAIVKISPPGLDHVDRKSTCLNSSH